MPFQKHPSKLLVDLFQNKPYQGQDPAKAKIIFLGSDANYSSAIADHAFFARILEYHADGVQFWRKHGVHHPFLLPDYPFDRRKGGVLFHRNFSKLRISCEHAQDISFLELLDVPTTGMRGEGGWEFFDLVSQSHIAYIDGLILDDRKKLILVPDGVIRDMRIIKKRFSAFKWLDESRSDTRFEKIVSGSEIRWMYHFSASQFAGSLPVISDQVQRWLIDAKQAKTRGWFSFFSNLKI